MAVCSKPEKVLFIAASMRKFTPLGFKQNAFQMYFTDAHTIACMFKMERKARWLSAVQRATGYGNKRGSSHASAIAAL